MNFVHKSVLLRESVDWIVTDPKGIYVDCTLGGAGHSHAIAEELDPEGLLIGIDQDEDAIMAASKRLEDAACKVKIVHSNFRNLGTILEGLNLQEVDGIFFDLGVSSYQLDTPERGFSYMHDAPLDMRMNQDDSFSAYDVVNGYDKKKLTEIIRKYGEERWASRISDFIVKHRREEGDIKTTGELVDIIKAAIPASARREGPHPAKRTFQAIRIEVNSELEQLENAIDRFCDVLRPGGRLCIITFHSLEDRIVKEAFQRRLNPCTCPKEFPVCVCGKVTDVVKVTGKPIISGEEELTENPRARSAKLRIIEKKR